MGLESASHDIEPDLRDGGELRKYSNGRVDVVYRALGARFNMAELADHFARNPMDQNSGAALVQVVDADGHPKSFYMDMGHAVPKGQPQLVVRLDEFPIADHAHDITVGEPWESPFGATSPVHALALPYHHGVHLDMLTDAPAGAVSPTETGRRIIDEALQQQGSNQG